MFTGKIKKSISCTDLEACLRHRDRTLYTICQGPPNVSIHVSFNYTTTFLTIGLFHAISRHYPSKSFTKNNIATIKVPVETLDLYRSTVCS